MLARHDWEGAPLRQQVYGPRYAARTYLIRRLVKRVRPRWTLDIGCGSGSVTRQLANLSEHVHAVDISEKAIDVSRDNLKDCPNVTFEVVDLFACPPEERRHLEGRFDLVVLPEILEHLGDDRGALRMVGELLLPGGCVVATVPADPRQWGIDDDLAGHKRRYTKEELHVKFEEVGFEIKSLVNWGFPFTRALVGVERRLMASSRLQELPVAAPAPLVRLASPLFSISAAIEPLFSFTDAGVGYVLLAEARKEA